MKMIYTYLYVKIQKNLNKFGQRGDERGAKREIQRYFGNMVPFSYGHQRLRLVKAPVHMIARRLHL